ncbi:MAG: DUF1840 domain-containing protein [Curvibacter sp.]|jgi:hypothetical protein|nr:DUF1840 domain-containing protein [Curvibacter sp.]
MLYKFKSRATPDLIMFEPNGRRVLQIVGKFSEDRRGILLPAEMPAAVAALEAAITQDEAQRRAAEAKATDRGEELPEAEGVSLRQRATPFIEMLRRCEAAGKEIVWGV